MKQNLVELGRRVATLCRLNNPSLTSTSTTTTTTTTTTSTSSILRSFSSSSSAPFSPASNNKLFVAGLSWSVDEKSLKDAFSTYGEVTEVRIMYDKETGRSRGFGFVYFSKEDEATSAKDAMDGKAFLGRPLRISFALDKVRGAPVVVPRLRNTGNAAGQND